MTNQAPVPNNQELQTAHDSMLEGLGQLADYLGFNKIVGQIYGTMLMSNRPLCLDDLVERLGISKANASTNMRTLENLGMARQIWGKGGSGKRKFYESETDFWQIITNIISGREMRDIGRALSVIDDNITRLNTAIPTMTDNDQALATLYIERMEKMQVLFKFAELMIGTILNRANTEDLSDVSHIEIG